VDDVLFKAVIPYYAIQNSQVLGCTIYATIFWPARGYMSVCCTPISHCCSSILHDMNCCMYCSRVAPVSKSRLSWRRFKAWE